MRPPVPAALAAYRDARRRCVARRHQIAAILSGRERQISDDLWEALLRVSIAWRREAIAARAIAMPMIEAQQEGR